MTEINPMLVTFESACGPRAGVLFDREIVDLSSVSNTLPDDVLGIVSAQMVDRAISIARAALACHRRPFDEVALYPPIPRPGKIVCFGLNYVDHASESGFAKPDYPSIFLRTSTSLTAHGGPLSLPRASEKFDFEGELAVVIGRGGRHISAKEASGHVCAYSCFNDGSVRDFQLKTTQWTIGKNFDGSGGFGPGLVSASVLPKLAIGLELTTRVNGARMQSANTRDMIFPVAEGIEIVSEAMTLEPGDILVMGTPSGVGQSRTPPVFLKAGDLVEVEIDGLGVLRNTVQNGL